MKNEEIWFHTQNPRRFTGFTVVVVTFFIKILDDFHDFVSECVSFPKKINNSLCGVTFFQRKVTVFIGRETTTHILPTKINEQKSLRSALLSISNNNTTTHLDVGAEELSSQSGPALLGSWLVKLGASQSIVHSDDTVNIHPSGAELERRITESAFLFAWWTWRHGWGANTDALKAALRGGSKTLRQEASRCGKAGRPRWRWLRLCRVWVGGGAGRAATSWSSSRLWCLCVPLIQFIDIGWILLCRDGYSQCKLCS